MSGTISDIGGAAELSGLELSGSEPLKDQSRGQDALSLKVGSAPVLKMGQVVKGADVKNYVRGFFLLASILLSAGSLGRTKAQVDSDLCKEKLLPLFGESMIGSGEDRVSLVKSLASQCEGSGAYALALASAQLIAGDYSGAEKVAREGMVSKDADKARLTYVVFKAQVGRRDFSSALVTADLAIKELPNSNMGLLLKGEYFEVGGDFSRSIFFLEKARKISSNSEVNNHLVVDYYNVGRYLDAVSAFESSEKMDDTAISSLKTVLGASASYYEIGDRAASLRVLDRHLALFPKSRNNKQFIKMKKILSGA